MATRNKALPESEMNTADMPDNSNGTKELPVAGQEEAKIPGEINLDKDLPVVGNPENTIVVDGELIEIKPTKLKYQRNRTAVFYHILEMYPLTDILAMGEKSFGDGLDGDKKLYDWLVAVTDNEEFVRKHYDNISSDVIYRMLEIFRRVNKIAELEAKLKNAKTPGEA